ncbi:hypothetical protein DB88DRAFT_443318 [Papiliotrema laurentii]|uniref:NAD-dependent epimerase/dehydratase domain-containing protein n=1 Tax=Papiliotrema laurentii TaxID=5418 RepID=A0AAD9FQ23_PAPLA|nr:hypothetical protein DB88DRAFT_443318 [Papiliotrema laurentii]
MPAVLITGVSGFLAAHVALIFLENGWTVHGTLRSDPDKYNFAATPLAPYITQGQLKLFTVGPLESADWTEAIRGVEAVVHTASPVDFTPEDFVKRHLEPAVRGTVGVLEVAAGESGVKSVVLTGSSAASADWKIPPEKQAGKVYTEDDWNPYTKEELTKLSDEHSQGEAYPAGTLYYKGAKKYAELAAWELHEKHGKPWPMTVLVPTMFLGPPIHPLASLSGSNLSTQIAYSLLAGKDAPVPDTPYPNYVDVRDIARAHYEAVVRKTNGRFNINGGVTSFQEVVDLGRKLLPELDGRLALGTPGKYFYKEVGTYWHDNTKSKEQLGLTYRSKEETVKDTLTRLVELEKQGLH